MYWSRVLPLLLPAGQKGSSIADKTGMVKVVVAVCLDEVVSLAKVLQADGALAVRNVPLRQAVLGHLRGRRMNRTHSADASHRDKDECQRQLFKHSS